MDLELILTDLSTKFPRLQHVFRPEYAPYLNTAGTVLLGWLIVSWISYVLWSFLATVTITVIAIILICPATVKWCLDQAPPNLEFSIKEHLQKFLTFLSNFCR